MLFACRHFFPYTIGYLLPDTEPQGHFFDPLYLAIYPCCDVLSWSELNKIKYFNYNRILSISACDLRDLVLD